MDAHAWKVVSVAVLLAVIAGKMNAATPEPDPTTPEPTTTTETPTTQDPHEARYILCQVMCQEKFVACHTDPTNVHYRSSLAMNVDNLHNAKKHRSTVCGSLKSGCREKCTWLKDETHMYDRNCTATNFLAGLDFNKPGFSLKKELKTLKYITT